MEHHASFSHRCECDSVDIIALKVRRIFEDFEVNKRGKIQAHGMIRLKVDPGLPELIGTSCLILFENTNKIGESNPNLR